MTDKKYKPDKFASEDLYNKFSKKKTNGDEKMKTKLIIEIESPDKVDIFPEEGQTDEDWEGKEDELLDVRNEFAIDLHKKVISEAETYFKDYFEEDFMENVEECGIEDCETFEDYKIKITVTKEPIKDEN